LPIIGAVKQISCSAKLGSVIVSWYPPIPVVKTASPKATPGDATDLPRNTVPSSSTR
jgi:hypothetical protein